MLRCYILIALTWLIPSATRFSRPVLGVHVREVKAGAGTFGTSLEEDQGLLVGQMFSSVSASSIVKTSGRRIYVPVQYILNGIMCISESFQHFVGIFRDCCFFAILPKVAMKSTIFCAENNIFFKFKTHFFELYSSFNQRPYGAPQYHLSLGAGSKSPIHFGHGVFEKK